MPSPLNETAARRAPEPELSANRKLIRPSLAGVRAATASAVPPVASPLGSNAAHAAPAYAPPHPPGHTLPPPAHFNGPVPGGPPRTPKKPVPPDQTNAESFYFLKQMQTKTEMVVVLHDGERLRGVIEWYDRYCLKVHREGEPNLLVYKSVIKYMYKAEDETRAAK